MLENEPGFEMGLIPNVYGPGIPRPRSTLVGKASGTNFETNAAAGDLSSGGKILRFPRYFVSDFLDFGD